MSADLKDHPTTSFTVAPIAWARGGRPTHQDDHWGGTRCTIELDARFGPEALLGLDAFSHLEVIYLFDQLDPDDAHTGARHPRHNPDWPLTGIFAQRARKRPNRLGLSRARILSVGARTIEVEGLDALDGTPILDLKPLLIEGMPDPAQVRQPAWATALMSRYYAQDPDAG